MPPLEVVLRDFVDENRARVVSSDSLRSVIFQLTDTSLLPFTIPVLYNICVDYGILCLQLPVAPQANFLLEPAQQQASDLCLSKELIQLISSPRFNDSRAFLGYTCKILELLITRRELLPTVVFRKLTKEHSIRNRGCTRKCCHCSPHACH
jgi:hypothetical protein